MELNWCKLLAFAGRKGVILVKFFCLKDNLSDINITLSFLLLGTWSPNFHSFNLSVSSCYRYVSFKQLIIGFLKKYTLAIFIFNGGFRLFTFILISDIWFYFHHLFCIFYLAFFVSFSSLFYLIEYLILIFPL